MILEVVISAKPNCVYSMGVGAEIKREPYKDPLFIFLAEWTGLEPATPGVTGRYSNQLNYHSVSGGC